MDTRRSQLNLDDLLRLRWLLGSLLALLSAWTVFFMEIEAWLLLGLVTAAGVAGIARPAWPLRVPRWVHRLAFPTILAVFAYDLYASREPLPALLRLDLLLILYRLMMHRRRREDLQLVVLGLFLVVVGGVLSVSLAFAAQIIAFTGCALGFLFLIHLAEPAPSGAAAAEPAEAAAWTRGRWRDVFARVRAATDWRLVVLAGGLFAGVVLLSGLLFLAIPRFEFQSGLFLDRLINRQTFTGFSDSIEFGEVTAITEEGSVALMVDVPNPAAIPDVPYWRMVVLDEYTGRGFRISPALRAQLGRGTSRRVEHGSGRPRAQAPEWTFYLEPGISRYLPLLGDFHRIEFNEPQSFARHAPTGVMALLRDPPKMLAYRVRAMETDAAMTDAGLALARRGGQRLDESLELPLAPEDRERLDRILRQLGPTGDPLEFGRRAIEWLARHHAYALNSALPEGSGDPLVRWLDSATPGHCEFFAGSFVLLARAAGFPARLVTGFKGGSWNAYSGSFAVRNTNAHAWCEVFSDASGAWIRMDPTPGSGAAAQEIEEALGAGAAGRRPDTGWRARLESLRVFWYRRIVNFDQGSQLELATAAKETMQRATQRLRQWLDARAEALVAWLQRPWGAGRAVWLGLAGLAGVSLAWVWRRRGRSWWLRWRSRHSRGTDRDPVRREAARWLRRATEGKRDQPPWPAALQADLLRLRYGAPTTWPDPAAVFRRARQAARRRSRSATD